MSDATIDKLKKLNTPTLANVLDELGIDAVLSGLVPAVPGLRLVGRAVTARETTAPKGSFAPEDFRVGHIIDAAETGDVIVVANGGAPVSTWGGMASYAAKLKGIAGIVVDGGVRDREEIEAFAFPVFSRHVVPTPGRTRIRVETIGEAVVCAGVVVRPRDVIVADGTGVLCLPAQAAAEIAERATGYAAADRRAMKEMKEGLSFREALTRFTHI